MKKYDLIVIGGGFAGFGAAVAAARQGAKVLLIERSNALSGAAAVELVLPFMRNATNITADNGENYIKELSAGIFEEIVSDLIETSNGDRNGSFDDEYLKLILNRMAISSGVELLFDATVTAAERERNKIKNVTVYGRGMTYTFEADYFIDATGDANLTAMAGFSYRLGRESDGLCQPMTLNFRLSGVDLKEFYKIHKEGEPNKTYKRLKAEGKIKNPREDMLIFGVVGGNGQLHFNSTRVVRRNPCDLFDITAAEIEAREQVFELLDFLKSNFECFKNCRVASTALEIGIRESRMIDGEYVLTGKDLVELKRFDDSIAVGNYEIDIHNPEGSGTSHYFFKPGEYYQIPYRTLIPKNAENLLVAGRCISADHEAQAAIRIMPIVCTLGEAAGTAIAIAKKTGCYVKDVSIKQLQQTLRDNGAVID